MTVKPKYERVYIPVRPFQTPDGRANLVKEGGKDIPHFSLVHLPADEPGHVEETGEEGATFGLLKNKGPDFLLTQHDGSALCNADVAGGRIERGSATRVEPDGGGRVPVELDHVLDPVAGDGVVEAFELGWIDTCVRTWTQKLFQIGMPKITRLGLLPCYKTARTV